MGQESENEDFIAIPIREFIAAPVTPVDLYVRLSDLKFVLIVKQDTRGAGQQLIGLESKNVEHLWVRRQDYGLYVGSSVLVAGFLLTQKEISSARKAEFLVRASSAVMNEIEALGLGVESYEHARLIAGSVTSLIEAKSQLFNLLSTLSTLSSANSAHAVGVSAIAVIIAKAQGWTKPATFEKLALGCLLHDVGLKEIPASILAKTRAEMTADDQATYETHPFRAMEILRSISSAPEDVIAIALEHHENAIGQGYPRKLRDLRMNPLAKVAALADCLAELTLPNEYGRAPLSLPEAIAQIEGVMGQPFNRDSFAALKELVKKDLKDAA